jgi:uncharacterized damage-inducible protein DinB
MSWNRILVVAALGVVASTSVVRANAVPGIRGEYLESLADAETKLVSLAKAMPDKKYTWRPAKGVRSVSEVFMHVAGANFIYPSFNGVKPPESIEPDMEKNVIAKDQVVATLEKSFAHLRAAITSTPDSDLDKTVKTFLGDMSVRALYLLATTHAHEHLGQSIAYARVNGVTPPWTAEQEAKDKAATHGENKGD